MTLSYGAFFTIVVICSIAIVALLFFLFFKWLNRQNEQIVSLIGSLILGSGVLSFYLLKQCHTPVVEVRGFDSEEYVYLFGSAFTASDEQVINLPDKVDGAIVINLSDQTMFVERIEYSLGGIVSLNDGEDVEEVAGHSFTILNKPPDFYPWEGTPGEITVSGKAMYAEKIWVHY